LTEDVSMQDEHAAPNPEPQVPGEMPPAGQPETGPAAPEPTTVAAADEESIARAADLLRQGEVVAFPTETVYGLGADASNAAAVAKIYRLKGRPANHPVIVHLADAAALDRWAREVPDAAMRLARAFWPGLLTLTLAPRYDLPTRLRPRLRRQHPGPRGRGPGRRPQRADGGGRRRPGRLRR
jgi:hypothetical protein